MIRTSFTAAIAVVAAGHMVRAQDRVIEITPDETVLVERYVETAPPPPVVEEHMTLRPGSVIPVEVPLKRFGDVPALRKYAYFLSVDHKIVVADPETRVVVRILDMKS
jgi:hypothetical protein